MATSSRLQRDAAICPWTIARKLAETLLQDYPEALKSVLGLLRSRNLPSICELGVILDQEYQDQEFYVLQTFRQIAAIFKKNSAFVSENAEEVAFAAFEKAEKICRISNKRLLHFYFHQERIPEELRNDLLDMEHYIRKLLGDVNPEIYNELARNISLTPGATEDRTRKRSYPFLKVTGQVRAPSKARPYITALFRKFGITASSWKFHKTEQNSIVMVPKNWKTFRTIAKEPTHSLPWQLSIDKIIKHKLLRWGVDLHSQKKNQELARIGSLDGSFATIDLSMASDTLCYQAVAWMLPPKWFELINSFRSSSYKFQEHVGTYAKFSSMGNGYTFALESLFFSAACKAVGSTAYAVYGDDIVVESEYAQRLLRLLRFLGFVPNRDKTYTNQNSRFRESCGCDYFNGRLVTPIYVREIPKRNESAAISHIVNSLVKVSFPGPLWDHLKELVRNLGLRIVPFNYDTCSGVHISVHAAYDSKKLFLARNRRKDIPRDLEGVLVFRGYGQHQRVRNAHGWRSSLHWHIRAMNQKKAQPTTDPSRFADKLFSKIGKEQAPDTLCLTTSSVVVRSVYQHSICRYSPALEAASDVLPLWSDELLGAARGKTRAAPTGSIRP